MHVQSFMCYLIHIERTIDLQTKSSGFHIIHENIEVMKRRWNTAQRQILI